MVVSIEFWGNQFNITKTDSINMPATKNTVVKDVLEFVRRQYPALLLDDHMVIAVVNHEIAPLDRALKANDKVSFLPYIGGG